MVKTNYPVKTAVLGMGNLLLKDEGVGVHIAQALQETPLPYRAELEVIDGATSPDVFLLLKETDKLVVIDAVQAGGEPGAIYRFRPEDVESEEEVVISAHQTNLLENLKLLGQLEEAPKDIVIIGIQPKDTDWGLELSAELQQRIPDIVKVVLNEVGLNRPDKREKGEK